MNKWITSILFIFILGVNHVFAQNYKKDSLQFKIYTTAFFKNALVKSITLDTVFCDYCSDSQLTALGQLGLKTSNEYVKNPEYRLINGKRKLAIYIRIAKKDFAKIKEKDTIK
ncbi:MAG: hypothetical protein WA839_04230 [Flavobacteriaceae bacterium]|tara:strand:- start:487 stop:825 length:339 start_codon:yes stop_codon:yes gene_type:complete